MSWPEIGRIFNKELRGEERWYDESAYRKDYQSAKGFYEDVFSHMIGDSRSAEIKEQMDELYKLKRQYFDQKREYNKILTQEARADHLLSIAREMADKALAENQLTFDDVIIPTRNKEAILLLSDWHYGMTTDNIWNEYNTQICRQRVEKLITYTKKYLQQNEIDTLHVVLLGDFCHGAIHVSARVKSEEDVCDQIMNVAAILGQAIGELTTVVNKILIYSCYGNHMRTVQNKNDSINSDNMEKLIPWYLKALCKDVDKIEFPPCNLSEYTFFKVFDYNICCVHGNLDGIKNIGLTANTLFTKRFGEPIDYTISGDKHHLEEFEQYGIESILVRSLCGTDDYANDRRLYSRPGQTLLIFNDEYGREATYNIPLD